MDAINRSVLKTFRDMFRQEYERALQTVTTSQDDAELTRARQIIQRYQEKQAISKVQNNFWSSMYVRRRQNLHS